MQSLPLLTGTRSGNQAYARRRRAAARQMRNPPPRRPRLSALDRQRKEEFVARRDNPDPRRYLAERATEEARVEELIQDDWRVKRDGDDLSVLGYLGHVYVVSDGYCSCPHFERMGSCYHVEAIAQMDTDDLREGSWD